MDQPYFAVVGASGFIGRALVARLRREGRAVAAISRHGNASDDVRISSYLDQGAVEAAIGDTCQVLFHLAALAHRRSGDEAAFLRANVETALVAARAAIARGVRRFVFVSSIGVIGSESYDGPFVETTPPQPTAFYAKSKWRAEAALREILEPAGVEFVIVRPPLVYGPGAPGNFGLLARMAGWPLPFGAITQNVRSFVGIDNLVDFLFTAAQQPAAAGQILLVTDGQDVSTAELLERMAASMGRRAHLISVPTVLLKVVAHLMGRCDVARQLLGSLQVDASRSARLLGWTPPVSLDEGLRRAMVKTR